MRLEIAIEEGRKSLTLESEPGDALRLVNGWSELFQWVVELEMASCDLGQENGAGNFEAKTDENDFAIVERDAIAKYIDSKSVRLRASGEKLMALALCNLATDISAGFHLDDK